MIQSWNTWKRGSPNMDCVGYRMREGMPYQLDAGMWIYLKAYSIPRRPAFKVEPWWQVDVMHPDGKCHDSRTLWVGDEAVVEPPPGMYSIRLNGMVKATPHELSIHACILTEGRKAKYPLRHTQMPCVESGELTNGTTRVEGQSLNLAGLRAAYAVFQPTEVVKGIGRAEVTLEHSPDNLIWEPVSHGGFPHSKLIIDQEDPRVISEQMALNGVHQYVRWAYNPTDVLGWGIRGRFYYSYESIHRR